VPEYIALLRAVNVGGQGQLPMADLRAIADGRGFSHVRTYLQSGNLLFRADARPTRDLEADLERATRDRLHLATDFIVRTATEWAAARARNPFPDAARDDPAHLVTVFLKGPPRSGADRHLREAIRGRERARVVGSHAYVVYPDGIARSRLTLPVIETALGVHGTGRNWNTVTQLAARIAEENGPGRP
jgi:uncharacterized protein (DUF1697 family)